MLGDEWWAGFLCPILEGRAEYRHNVLRGLGFFFVFFLVEVSGAYWAVG